MKIEYDHLNKIVIASIFGAVGVSGIIELINESVRFGRKHNCSNILFNMTEAEEILSFIDEYELCKNLNRITELTPSHYCAVVYHFNKLKNENELTFKEVVAQNWGQRGFKVFFDKEEGTEWLKRHIVKRDPLKYGILQGVSAY